MNAMFGWCLLMAVGMTSEIEKGVSLSLAKSRRSAIKNVDYTLSFSLIAQGPIDGDVVIDFDLQKQVEEVVFDFNAPATSLKRVLLNDRPTDFQFKNGHLHVSAKEMESARQSVSISFVAGDLSLNRNQDFMYTLLVPDRASSVFPCFDQPDLKGRFQLQLEMPKDWIACTNGPRQRTIETISNTIEGPRKRKLVTYDFTKPISTYLFAFAAGKFQRVTREIDGREMTMYHREPNQSKVVANADKIFETHRFALDWLEEYTGINYPFSKFDFVLIPSFQYGGMEHSGSIFYNADQLLLDESATKDQKLRRASLIAHETAHMWFGNLVTMKWFNDVWLKEVFANFMAAKIVHPSFPEINHRLGFLWNHHPSAYGEDRSQGTHPIQQQLKNLKDAGTLYGRIIYQKAPVVMRQLETMVGELAFRDGIREYLRRFSFGNAVWDDLVEILDAKSDVDLRSWSDAWVKESGTPVVTSRIVDQAIGKTIKIQQLNRTEREKYWTQQVDIKVVLSNEIVLESRVTISDSQDEIELKKFPSEYDFYLVNGSELGYGYFQLEPQCRFIHCNPSCTAQQIILYQPNMTQQPIPTL
ncbi:MAG: M1 family aminopeptidase, partial [Planctomycetota bacterium]